MTGKYELVIGDNRIEYRLTLERQVTVLCGDSGTGKTTLVQLCRNVERGIGGVRCNQRDRLAVFEVPRLGRTLKEEYERASGNIFICDEYHNKLFRTQEFAELVRHSDNYFLIISRSGCLGMLSYSIKSVFAFDKRERIHHFHQKHMERRVNFKPDVVVTEDSKAGYQFFKKSLKCKVVSAEGKSNVWSVAERERVGGKLVCCVVDGAAFGADLTWIVNGKPNSSGVCILAPESFEWLILSTSLYRHAFKAELERTYDFCDTKEYLSWERYYTALLARACGYSKGVLPPEFLKHRREVLSLLGEIDNSVWVAGVVEQAKE